MPVIQPPLPRYTIKNLSSSLIITIPSHKNWFIIFFIGFWLIGWAVGEIAVGGILLTGAITLLGSLLGLFDSGSNFSGTGAIAFSGVGLFLIGWFGAWTVGGFFAIRSFLWQLTGVENIEVDSGSITLQRLIFNFGRPKTYLAEHIKDLRTVSNNNYPFGWSRGMNFWGLMDGSIAFDYGAKTFRCGSGADEAEAKDIIKAIQERFPHYQTK